MLQFEIVSAKGSRLVETILAIVENAMTYSAVETLRDGRRLDIRALELEDRPGIMAAVGRTSLESLYHRFFTVKRSFTEQEVSYFLNIDFVDHVAIVAVVEEQSRPIIVGGGRYIVMQPGKAELALAVIDEYQRQGIGGALIRHLARIARDAELSELVAYVLPDNYAMMTVFEKSGLALTTQRNQDVLHVSLRLDATPAHIS